jgi:hypothetical protein
LKQYDIQLKIATAARAKALGIARTPSRFLAWIFAQEYERAAMAFAKDIPTNNRYEFGLRRGRIV